MSEGWVRVVRVLGCAVSALGMIASLAFFIASYRFGR